MMRDFSLASIRWRHAHTALHALDGGNWWYPAPAG